MPAAYQDDAADRLAVRKATGADAATVGDVYMRSWLDGYEGLVASDRLLPVAADRAAYDWVAAIGADESRFALGFVDGLAAGITKIGPDPTESAPGTWLDLLYVTQEFWGTGIARKLLEWAVVQAQLAGAPLVRLRVVEAQRRARRFYEREGWTYDDDIAPTRNDFFDLICMRLDLAGPRSPRGDVIGPR